MLARRTRPSYCWCSAAGRTSLARFVRVGTCLPGCVEIDATEDNVVFSNRGMSTGFRDSEFDKKPATRMSPVTGEIEPVLACVGGWPACIELCEPVDCTKNCRPSACYSEEYRCVDCGDWEVPIFELTQEEACGRVGLFKEECEAAGCCEYGGENTSIVFNIQGLGYPIPLPTGFEGTVGIYNGTSCDADPGDPDGIPLIGNLLPTLTAPMPPGEAWPVEFETSDSGDSDSLRTSIKIDLGMTHEQLLGKLVAVKLRLKGAQDYQIAACAPMGGAEPRDPNSETFSRLRARSLGNGGQPGTPPVYGQTLVSFACLPKGRGEASCQSGRVDDSTVPKKGPFEGPLPDLQQCIATQSTHPSPPPNSPFPPSLPDAQPNTCIGDSLLLKCGIKPSAQNDSLFYPALVAPNENPPGGLQGTTTTGYYAEQCSGRLTGEPGANFGFTPPNGRGSAGECAAPRLRSFSFTSPRSGGCP